jgi:nickel transport protein
MLIASLPALSHDLWLDVWAAGEGNEYTLYSGHLPSGHEGQEFIKYDPAIVEFAACFDSLGHADPADVTAQYPVRISCSGGVIFVLTSTGYWSRTPYGLENVPKSKTDRVIITWLSRESIKRVDRWSEAYGSPLVDELELVPLVDPLSLESGDKLRLLVTKDGGPVKGAVVAYGGKIRGETGEDGRINIKIRHSGIQLVQASLTERAETPEADEIRTTTTLCFELPDTED